MHLVVGAHQRLHQRQQQHHAGFAHAIAVALRRVHHLDAVPAAPGGIDVLQPAAHARHEAEPVDAGEQAAFQAAAADHDAPHALERFRQPRIIHLVEHHRLVPRPGEQLGQAGVRIVDESDAHGFRA